MELKVNFYISKRKNTLRKNTLKKKQFEWVLYAEIKGSKMVFNYWSREPTKKEIVDAVNIIQRAFEFYRRDILMEYYNTKFDYGIDCNIHEE